MKKQYAMHITLNMDSEDYIPDSIIDNIRERAVRTLNQELATHLRKDNGYFVALNFDGTVVL